MTKDSMVYEAEYDREVEINGCFIALAAGICTHDSVGSWRVGMAVVW